MVDNYVNRYYTCAVYRQALHYEVKCTDRHYAVKCTGRHYTCESIMPNYKSALVEV